MLALLAFSCSTDELSKNVITVDSSVMERGANKNVYFAPMQDGSIENQLSSLEIIQAPSKPDRLVWTAFPTTLLHVVITDENGNWLMQTSTNGNTGFYIRNYYKVNDPNDGNIWIVKNVPYKLYFPLYDIYVDFTLTGRIN